MDRYSGVIDQPDFEFRTDTYSAFVYLASNDVNLTTYEPNKYLAEVSFDLVSTAAEHKKGNRRVDAESIKILYIDDQETEDRVTVGSALYKKLAKAVRCAIMDEYA